MRLDLHIASCMRFSDPPGGWLRQDVNRHLLDIDRPDTFNEGEAK